MPTPDPSDPTARRERPKFSEHPLDWLLTLFADVRAGEGATALLLTLNVFVLLTAYYLLKVAREPLILVSGGGAEVKSYASVAQSILLVFVTSAYGWLASRVGRMQLIGWVIAMFVMNLVVFWALGERGVPLGVPFFLWVGIFNLMSIAQFWSFAADVYTDEQGKRLFPIIGIGSSIGAVVGAWIAGVLVKQGPFRLMLFSAGMLLICLALTYVVHRRESERAEGAGVEVGKEKKRKKEDAPLGHDNGFSLLLRDKYLLLFAAVLFVLNFVTKTGDYVLDKWLLEAAHGHADPGAYVGEFKARYFAWSNGFGVVCQLFFVSRIIKHLGMRWALYLMPLASLAGYGASFVTPVLGVLFVARVIESGLDYSLWNTTRNALWLVTTREAKYKVKQIIDTFIVRLGDALSAGLVWVGVRWHLQLPTFIAVNLALSAIWLVLVVFLAREHTKRTTPAPAPS
jgi:ATP:ADP antiporter, AAA family